MLLVLRRSDLALLDACRVSKQGMHEDVWRGYCISACMLGGISACMHAGRRSTALA